MVKFNRLLKLQLWIVCFKIWQGWLRHADQQPCQIWLRSYRRWRPLPHGGEISGRVPFIIIIIIVFSFLATRTAHTREPIFTHDSSKDVVWRREVTSKQVFFEILTFWGSFSPENPTNLAGIREIPAKMKRLNNPQAVDDRQNMSMKYEYKLGVTLSESVVEKFVRCPLVEDGGEVTIER